MVRAFGVGGMGTVYEVEHELTRHRRALKLLHAELAGNPQAVARFLPECVVTTDCAQGKQCLGGACRRGCVEDRDCPAS